MCTLLAAHVLDRDAHVFAVGELVAEFHLAHLVGVAVERSKVVGHSLSPPLRKMHLCRF